MRLSYSVNFSRTYVANIVCSLLVIFPQAAFAGAFGIHGGSTQFLGTGLASAAAGNALSSMFWNPAAVGEFEGIQAESAFTLIVPHVEIYALPGSNFFSQFSADSGDTGKPALVPSSYMSYQISPALVFGLSINAPFGLGGETKQFWAGQTRSRQNKTETHNFAPTIGYRLTPELTVGAGVQVEYIRGKLQAAFPVAPFPDAINTGDDIGFTLGALWKPGPGTSVGLGFRSPMDHTFEGSFGVHGIGKNVVR